MRFLNSRREDGGKPPFDWKYIPVALLGLALLGSTLDRYGGLFEELAERASFHEALPEPEAERPVPAETVDLLAVPQEIPEAVVYTGSGEDYISIDPPEGPWVLHAAGNAEGGYFSVTGYDRDGEFAELFVNTAEPYDGVTFDPWQSTTELEIYAEGDWRIELLSVYAMDTVSASAPASGRGDGVFLLERPEEPWALFAACDGGDDYFSVDGYDPALESTQQFVSHDTPYTGVTWDMSQSTALLAVRAEGDWSLCPVTPDSLPGIGAGSSISGSGDAVYQVTSPCGEISVSGNREEAWFSVTAFDGENPQWLVSSLDPVEETIPLSFQPRLIAIEADGDWSLTLK